jgi:uncharacterized protein
MTIWAIADVHASRIDPETGLPSKPMDVFGPEWRDHLMRLEQAWDRMVQPEDTTIVAGDIDWALHLDEAGDTLNRIASWKGHKILIRGNHDYWWSSKTTNRVRKSLPTTIGLLHNNAFHVEGFNICGTKGSPVPGGIDWTAENAKLLNREIQRLGLSLEARDPALPTLVALHYPPFYPGQDSSPYQHLLEEACVAACVFGHLHGTAADSAPIGDYAGIQYALVAADNTGFQPVRVAEGGRIALDTVVGRYPLGQTQ